MAEEINQFFHQYRTLTVMYSLQAPFSCDDAHQDLALIYMELDKWLRQ